MVMNITKIIAFVFIFIYLQTAAAEYATSRGVFTRSHNCVEYRFEYRYSERSIDSTNVTKEMNDAFFSDTSEVDQVLNVLMQFIDAVYRDDKDLLFSLFSEDIGVSTAGGSYHRDHHEEKSNYAAGKGHTHYMIKDSANIDSGLSFQEAVVRMVDTQNSISFGMNVSADAINGNIIVVDVGMAVNKLLDYVIITLIKHKDSWYLYEIRVS